jgi:hypothetical protein
LHNLCATLAFVSLSMRVASATECVVSGPRYGLASDTVDWSIKIASGQTCIRGLRFNNVAIDSVRLISPPHAGQVTLLGPGFTYSTNSDYEGADSFTVAVSGTINRSKGSSTIRVFVSIGNPAPATAMRPDPLPLPQAPSNSTVDTATLPASDGSLPPCPIWDWSNGAPPPMRPPFDRSKLYCPPPPFKQPSHPIGCTCPGAD